MYNKQFWTALAVLGTCAVVLAEVSNNDITAQINKLESHIGNMRPPPEIIGELLQQIQVHCKKNRTIDQAVLTNASKCVEQYMNETQLIADIKKAVPEGQLDNVFKDVCLKWPKVRMCLNEFFVIIEDCWEKGQKVNQAVNEAVKFFCGDDNDGARIALFLAEGGMECLEKHGDSVKTCVENIEEFSDLKGVNPNDLSPDTPFDLDSLKAKIPTDVSKDDICEKLGQIKDCTTKELKKCKDPTPENLATSMIRAVGRSIDCQLKDDYTITTVKSGSDTASIFMGWLTVMVAGSVLL